MATHPLLDELPFTNPSEHHDRDSTLFLNLFDQFNSHPCQESRIKKRSPTTSKPSIAFPTVNSLQSTSQPLNLSISCKPMPDFSSFDTTSHQPFQKHLKSSLPTHQLPKNQFDKMSNKYNQPSSRLSQPFLPITKPSSVSNRASLPNFSKNPRHIGLMTIPFPTFEDDHEYAANTPNEDLLTHDDHRSQETCSSSLLTQSSSAHVLPQIQEFAIDPIHQSPSPTKVAQTSRSFLIGRKFDLDNSSLLDPQTSDDSHDFLGPDYSPTAKTSGYRLTGTDRVRDLKPLSLMHRQKQTICSSPLADKRTVLTRVSPPPSKPDNDLPRGSSPNCVPTNARRLKLRRFSLRKLSGSLVPGSFVQASSASSTVPSSSASPEDIRKANLGVERCGGLGNKMFDSGMRKLKRIVTAPIRSSSAYPAMVNDSPTLSLRYPQSSLQSASDSSIRTQSSLSPRSLNPSQSYPSQNSPDLSPYPSPGANADNTIIAKPSLNFLQFNRNIEDSPRATDQTSSPSTEAADLTNESVFFPVGIHQQSTNLPQSTTADHSITEDRLWPLGQLDAQPLNTFTSPLDSPHSPLSIVFVDDPIQSPQQAVIAADSDADIIRLDHLLREWRLLCHQVDQELKLSKERWPDTAKSQEASSSTCFFLQKYTYLYISQPFCLTFISTDLYFYHTTLAFVLPSSHQAVLEFLAHSRQTYGKTYAGGLSYPGPRQKQRRRLRSIFSNPHIVHKTHDPQPALARSNIEGRHRDRLHPYDPAPLGFTPPHKHTSLSRSATPAWLLARSRSRTPGASTPSSACEVSPSKMPFPAIVALSVPSAFVSPDLFDSPSSRPPPRQKRNSSLQSVTHPKPLSQHGHQSVNRTRNESLQSNLSMGSCRPLGETSVNVSPLAYTHRRLTMVRISKLSTTSTRVSSKKKKHANLEDDDDDREGQTSMSLPSRFNSHHRQSPQPKVSLGVSKASSPRKTKKAWKRGEHGGKSLRSMTSQSSLWDEENYDENEKSAREDEEETGVFVAAGENTFDTPL